MLCATLMDFVKTQAPVQHVLQQPILKPSSTRGVIPASRF